MEDSKLGMAMRKHWSKHQADTPFEGNENPVVSIPDPRPNKSIWAQYPMTTPNQWGAAAEAAYVGGQWISPDWTSLQTTQYWIGFYEHREAIIMHAEACWKKEGGE